MNSSKPAILVVISVLVVALIYSPASTTFYIFAAPPASGFLNSESCNIPKDIKTGDNVTCCWNEGSVRMCQRCTWTEGVGYSNCWTARPPISITGGEGVVAPLEEGVLEQPPTPPPSGPAAPLRDGGVLQQPPIQGVAPPPLTRGQVPVLPQDGVLQETPADQGAVEPPVTEGTQPATVEEEQAVPVCQEGFESNEDLGFCVPTECPEGQVLDEQSGLCVLEEPETVVEEEEPEQPEPEEPDQQEQTDNSEEDNSNN